MIVTQSPLQYRTTVCVSHSPSPSLLSHTQCGCVPLEIAAHNGHTETVQRLLELGANIDQQDKVIMNSLCYLLIFTTHCRMVTLHSTVPHSEVM